MDQKLTLLETDIDAQLLAEQAAVINAERALKRIARITGIPHDPTL